MITVIDGSTRRELPGSLPLSQLLLPPSGGGGEGGPPWSVAEKARWTTMSPRLFRRAEIRAGCRQGSPSLSLSRRGRGTSTTCRPPSSPPIPPPQGEGTVNARVLNLTSAMVGWDDRYPPPFRARARIGFVSRVLCVMYGIDLDAATIVYTLFGRRHSVHKRQPVSLQ